MRRSAALAVAVVLAAVPAAAAPAVADEPAVAAGSYLAAEGPIQRSGFWGSSPHITDQQILSIGYTQCDLHKRGLSDLQVLTEMAGYQPQPGSRAYEVGLASVRNAIRYICP